MNTTSQQSDYRPTGRSAFFTSLVVLLILFSYCYFSLHRSQASGDKPLSATEAQMPMTEDHYINIPYFAESGGMSSTLTLNNNETQAMSAKVTIFNQKGKQLEVPPISLQPEQAARFSLKELTANAGEDFDFGNIQVFFHGTSMGITSQVSIVSVTHRLAFESVETQAMDFVSTTLNGIVWTPDNETKARLALTNTTSALLSVTVLGNEKVQSIMLKARETRIIELEDFLEESRATLVTLDHHGPLGALIATGFALNERTGFSSNLNFVDCATARATRLAAAHVRFGLADSREGFPAGTNFRAPLVIANTMDMPTEAQISVTYTVHSAAKKVTLRPITLGAREVRLVELSQQMARKGVTGPVEDAGVDVSYTHMPGTVIGRLTSYDASGDYAFDVPVKDPLGHGSGGYPWRLDNGFTTVVHLKNTLNKEAAALVQVRYANGSYHPDRIKIGPYQTVAIDIRQLRDAQNKDIRGGVMPKDVESGQFTWFEEEFGSVIGRAEVADIRTGVASSFSCEGGCPCSTPVFDSCSMNPSSGSAIEGISGYMFAPNVMKHDCQFVQFGPYNPTAQITWSSSNTNVVTVDSGGVESTIAGGSGDIVARWPEVVGYAFTCGQPIYGNVSAGATCDVAFLRGSVLNPPISSDGDNAIAGTQFTFQVEAINPQGNRATQINVTAACSISGLAGAGETFPGGITVSNGVGSAPATLQVVAQTGDIGRVFVVTGSNPFSSSTTSGTIKMYFPVTMDLERWKNCNFVSCPQLGSYFCGTFCSPYNGSPQPAGPSQPLPFIALTASACDSNVRIVAGRNSSVAVTTVKDRGPTTNNPYWLNGNRPSTGGCMTDALFDQLGLPYSCNSGREQVYWRFSQ